MSYLNDYPNKKYYLGTDIGGTCIYLVLMDKDTNVISEKKVETSKDVSEIVNIIKAFLINASITIEQIEFISLGVPGTVNPYEGIVIDAPALDWENLPIVGVLEENIKCPIFLDNDVNCAAMGEKWLGDAKDCNDFIYISIGTGVGCAIYLNGALIRGYSFMAGEAGYLIFTEDIEKGNFNNVGEFGILESKISGSALKMNGFEPAKVFEEYYKKKSERTSVIINDFKKLLSLSIANIVSLLNPEKVIISGGVALSLDGMIVELNELVNKYTPIPTKISLSPLGEASGALGAVANGLNRIHTKRGSK